MGTAGPQGDCGAALRLLARPRRLHASGVPSRGLARPGHVEALGGLLFGGFAAAVVGGGGVGIGVAGEALDSADVGAGVEQVADVGAAEVVGAEGGNLGLLTAFFDQLVDGLVGDAFALVEGAGFVDGVEEGASVVAAMGEPVGEGCGEAGIEIDGAGFVALAPADGEAGLGWFVVGQGETGDFKAAQPGVEAEADDGGITRTGGSRVGLASGEQRVDFALGELAAGGLVGGGGADIGDIDGTVVVVAGDEFEPPSGLEHATDSREDPVGRAGAVGVHEQGAQGGGVGVAQLVPGEIVGSERIVGEQVGSDDQAVEHDAAGAGREGGDIDGGGMMGGGGSG